VSDGHPSFGRMDRILCGDATPEEAAAFHAHLGACPECQARFDAARAEDLRFHQEDAPDLRRAILSAPAPSSGVLERISDWMRSPAFAGGAALAACAIVIALWRPWGEPEGNHQADGANSLLAPGPSELAPPLPPTERTKGSPWIELHVKRGETVSRIEGPIVRLRVGDGLRVVPRDLGPRSLLLLTLSPGGRVDVLHPLDGVAAPVPDGIPLPGSFVQDEDPAPLQLFALFPDGPLDASEVRRALAAASGAPMPTRVPMELLQQSLRIEAETPR
jgi:hypothetical protein